MPLQPQEPFGFFVRRIRLEKGLSQLDVERNGGPTQTTVSDYEISAETDSPKRPTHRMIIRFARGLDIDIAEVEKAAGLMPGAARQPIPLHAVGDALQKAGMRPAWLSTGEVVYLTVDNPEPDETLIALESFLEGWYARKDSRAARQQKREREKMQNPPSDQTDAPGASPSD